MLVMWDLGKMKVNSILVPNNNSSTNFYTNGLFGLRERMRVEQSKVKLTQNQPIFNKLYSTPLHSPSFLPQSKQAHKTKRFDGLKMDKWELQEHVTLGIIHVKRLGLVLMSHKTVVTNDTIFLRQRVLPQIRYLFYLKKKKELENH